MKRVITLALVLFVRCGGGYGPGVGCSDTSQCQGGLQCIKATQNAPACDHPDTYGVCTIGCSSDAQCKTYGANFKCLNNCSNPSGQCVRF